MTKTRRTSGDTSYLKHYIGTANLGDTNLSPISIHLTRFQRLDQQATFSCQDDILIGLAIILIQITD